MTTTRFSDPPKPFTIRRFSVVVLGFVAATVILTYPQAFTLTTSVGPHYDALFSIWRLSWIAHQLPHRPLELFDANIFYPEHLTLAYSDALLLQGLIAAPFLWIGLSPVLVHNVMVLATFVLSGAAMFWLVRDLTGSGSAGFIAGMIFSFQPYRFGHYTQLELLSGWWIPIAFCIFERAIVSSSVVQWSMLGLVIALQTWSSIYYGVFLVTALGILTVVRLLRGNTAPSAAMVKAVLTGVLVAGVLVIPYLIPYLNTRQIVGERSIAEVTDWSPHLGTYLVTTREHWLYGALFGDRAHAEGILFPGLTALALALAGALPPINRLRIAYVVLLLLAFDLSLGFNGITYPVLYETAFPYRGLRAPGRLFILVSAALSVLAGWGFARIETYWRTRFHRLLLAGVVVTLIAAESATMPLTLVPVPTPDPMYRWLAGQAPSVVLEWPFPKTSTLGFTFDPTYMYFSTGHWQQLVNGYSGFHPSSYIRLLDALTPFPNPGGLAALRKLGVDYLILHRDLAPDEWDSVNQGLRASPLVRLVMTDSSIEATVAVYQIVGLGAEANIAEGDQRR
ncbi:MAG TPA: hypothetical protein VM096_00895 [Vicinamibacterales bacterium]|nr:hypothetical protein [Vicinamibacterales bacterium]